MKRFFFLILFPLFYLFSCAPYRDFDGEPYSEEDATPPYDYNPTFIKSIQAYDEEVNKQASIDVSTVDVRQPNLVKIKFNVIDFGSVHLQGLTADKFKNYWCEIVDSINGREIAIKDPKIYEVKENDLQKIAFGVVMDHSGSMGEKRARAVQNAIEKLILDKQDSDIITLLKYDDSVVVESHPSNSKSELLSNFKRNGLEGYGGMTATTDAVFLGLQELASLPKTYEKVLLVFTDGWDNSSKFPKDTAINLARMNNTIICAVDFGENINPDYMKYFSDSTSGIYKHIYLTEEFQYLFEDIYNRLKNYYVIEYRPNEFGDHKVYFRLCLPDDTVKTEMSYNNVPDIGSIGTLAINFDFNKSTIKSESDQEIEQIFALMKAYPKMEIELRGHTDSLNKTGDPEYNVKLSQKRADAVKQAIVKKGISSDRITSVGLGETEPVASNETEEGRALNRRTEFVVLKK